VGRGGGSDEDGADDPHDHRIHGGAPGLRRLEGVRSPGGQLRPGVPVLHAAGADAERPRGEDVRDETRASGRGDGGAGDAARGFGTENGSTVGGGGGRGSEPPYWPPGPFKALRPADVAGTWIAASFGPLGMDKQIFTFLQVGDRLRGVVCGRCDNPYTLASIEDIIIVGDTLYFTIAHEDWGESDPPRFGRNIVAQIVQNEMLAQILGKDLVVDPAKPPARPAGRPFTLVGPIAPEGTRGNSSEGIDVWGRGTGPSLQPPPGRTVIQPAFPGK